MEKGEAAFFRRDTWHHGFNCGTEPFVFLIFRAPAVSRHSMSAYAKTKPNLTEVRYTQDDWLGRWPMEKAEWDRSSAIKVLREPDYLWRMEGSKQPALIGLLISTDQLTAGKFFLLPGQQTEMEAHGGDESLYLLSGELTLCVDAPDSSPWYELKEGDGFYLPQGTLHRYCNLSDKPVEGIFGRRAELPRAVTTVGGDDSLYDG